MPGTGSDSAEPQLSTAQRRVATLDAGLLFGGIIGVVTLVDAVIQGNTNLFIFPGDFFTTAFALFDFQSEGAAGIASGVQLLTLLVLSFVAGRVAARRTGQVGSGVIAGIIAGTVGTLVGYVTGIVIAAFLFNPGQPLQTGSAAFQLGDASALLFLVIFDLIAFAPFYVGFGAGFAALGGEIGSRAYRKAHPLATAQRLAVAPPYLPGQPLPLPPLGAVAPDVTSSSSAARGVKNPIVLNGLIFGAILAVGLLVGTVVQQRTGQLTSPEDVLDEALELIGLLTAGLIVYAELIGLLVLSFVAGIRTARQTGKLGSGVLAGLFVGAAGSVVGYVIGSVVILWLLPLVAPLPQQQAHHFVSLLGAGLIGAENLVPIWTLLGGAIGLLGGLIGANRYRRAHPEMVYPTAPYAGYPPYGAYPPYPGNPPYSYPPLRQHA